MADATDPTEHAEARLGLAAARFAAGDPAAARAACLHAARLARTARRPDLLARSALALGGGPTGTGDGTGDGPVDREQIELLTEAREALAADAGRATLRAAVTARLAVVAGPDAPVQHRVDLAEEAVGDARAGGDPAVLGVALAALCTVGPGPDRCASRLARSAELVGVARDLPDPALELLGRRLRFVALLETGDIEGAHAEADAYEGAVRSLRRPSDAWFVPLWRGARALMEGRYEDCRTALAEAETLAEALAGRSADAAPLIAAQRWSLLAESGDLTGLERMLAGMPPLGRIPGAWPQVALGLVAAQFGHVDEAARRLTAVLPRLATAPRDGAWLPALAQAAETVALIGAHNTAPRLYALLAPYADLFVVEGPGAVVRGPVHRHLALLAASLGDATAARRHAEAARAAALWAGARGLLERIERETRPLRATEGSVGGAGGFDHPDGRDGPGGSDRPDRPDGHGPGSADADIQPDPEIQADLDADIQTDPESVFRLVDGIWQLRHAGREARLPDGEGLRDLAALLSRPGVPVPALDLATASRPGTLQGSGAPCRARDATVRAAYRRRMRELTAEAEAAEVSGDSGWSARVALERDALIGRLASAYGIGDRPRRTGSAADRVRTAVAARILAAIDRIAAVHPELGRHLAATVRTGTTCVYEPRTRPRRPE
ncbi:hypothetical protein ACWCP6_13030 [Streptomyces sp. NPDC002004]